MASSSSARGLRLLKAFEHYVKTKPNQFDTHLILSKMQLTTASDGHLQGHFTVDSSMCNSLNTLHGGYIASTIDAIAFFAQLSTNDGKLCWTTNMHVDFLKSAQKGDIITVETCPLKKGNYPVMEAILRNKATGILVAKGVVSLLAGLDKYQQLGKEIFNFDLDEN